MTVDKMGEGRAVSQFVFAAIFFFITSKLYVWSLILVYVDAMG